ncbi:MAG: peptide chain release factor N(5)-glutamine methyltransferase [Verrucomicrobia bacterium]|nr:peptide chain release factor N(5)-glutamine methyltransferase [Verrucomicrobiota bacterium]
MTVLEVIQRSTDYLAQKGVESPRRNIEEMLAQRLKLPRLQLYLNFDRALAEADLEVLRAMVKRRGQREPLQHILGSVCFCGLDLAANRHALVPRPETELLAEQAWHYLSTLSLSGPSVLDLGTGTGCLAITLAKKVPGAQVHAVEVSSEALALARQNAQTHGLADLIHFHEGDGFAALPPGLQFDLLVSNPPYIPSAEIETLQPEVRHFDPRLALDGGPDGLDFHRRIARETARWLKAGGRIMLEFGDGQAEALAEILVAQNWIVEARVEDYSRRPRILVVRSAT